jgi:hypothetical protein
MTSRRLTALRSVLLIIPAAGCTLAAFSCAKESSARVESRDREVAAIETAPSRPAPTPDAGMPGVRVFSDRVEVEGIVPIDCHHPDTPHIFLEVVACAPDTREHEALVMTKVRPSHIHAALLMLDRTPGFPGSWIWNGPGSGPTYTAPSGDEIDIFLRYIGPDGQTIERPVRDWIVDVDTGAPLPDVPFKFAGSRFVTYRGDEVYDADYAGNIVGLATFGNEVVAWTEVFSPESSVDAPRWIANPEVVPVYGTPVTLILKPRGEREPPGLMR